jgi:hypothetical protein
LPARLPDRSEICDQYTIKGAGWFDIKFVNGFGAPFFLGFGIFFILLAAAIIFAIAMPLGKILFLKLGLWCTVTCCLAIPLISPPLSARMLTRL